MDLGKTPGTNIFPYWIGLLTAFVVVLIAMGML